MKKPILFSVGYHKGEMDFGVNASMQDLTREEMSEFRQMLVVGIGQAENMWRKGNESHPSQALDNTLPNKV